MLRDDPVERRAYHSALAMDGKTGKARVFRWGSRAAPKAPEGEEGGA